MSKPIKHSVPVSAPQYRIKRGSAVKYEGQQVRELAVATYDVAVDGGAIGAHGLGVFIPDNAIITNAWIDVVTTFTDGDTDAATIALHLQSAGDLVAAIAISNATNVWDAGIRGTLVNNPNLGADAAHDTALEVIALYAATKLKLTAEREVTATVATAALTAGKMNIFIEYVISE